MKVVAVVACVECVGIKLKSIFTLLQVNDRQLRMLSVLHSLLVYQSLSGIYSDVYCWSVSDLTVAVDQLQTVSCDLQSVDDATQILTRVYAARCDSERDAEKLNAFIFRLIRAWAASSNVIIVDFTVACFTQYVSCYASRDFSILCHFSFHFKSVIETHDIQHC